MRTGCDEPSLSSRECGEERPPWETDHHPPVGSLATGSCAVFSKTSCSRLPPVSERYQAPLCDVSSTTNSRTTSWFYASPPSSWPPSSLPGEPPPLRTARLCCFTSSHFMAIIVLLLLLGDGSAQQVQSRAINGVCGNTDVRNSINNFGKLRGCQVVEGNLQVVLISGANDTINNVTFPMLREVTGYVIIWRVAALQSLGTLFPNLSVIRGRKLLQHYSLIVYENADLTEIGLTSLTLIERGNVILAKNKRLCFVETIDWSLITLTGGSNFIKDNRPQGECAKCGALKGEDCITAPEPRCWTKDECQKYAYSCPQKIRGRHGGCCHDHCVGGCSGPTSNDCFACKNAVLGTQCLGKCPPNTFLYENRRCVTEEVCLNMTVPAEIAHSVQKKHPYRAVADLRVCSLGCPARFMEKEVRHGNRTVFVCVPCPGLCRKDCSASNVDSLSAAQNLTGCTHIAGSLEIQLRTGGVKNLVNELEASLGSIEEIDGYLKVVSSKQLISLNFLKNLKVIRGNILDSQDSAFILLDNENLQEIWNRPENATFQIQKGQVFFHWNPKLCYYKIEKFRQMAGLKPFTEHQAPRDSNGDKEACNKTVLYPRVTRIHSASVVITWAPFELTDVRKLLGYIIEYVRAPYRNVSLYDGRDACGGDGWYAVYVTRPKDEEAHVVQVITHLQPFTQYAFYVKTYTTKTESTGGQSEITYFMTAPGTPKKPTKVVARSISPSEILVTWSPPSEIHGVFSHYLFTALYHKEDDLPDNHKFCDDPLIIKDEPVTRNVPFVPLNPTESGLGTAPKHDSKKNKQTDDERQFEIQFEDDLLNLVYVRKRDRREVEGGEKHGKDNGIVNVKLEKNSPISYNDDGYLVNINQTVSGKPELALKNLVYFGEYRIEIQVCRQVVYSPENGMIDKTDACGFAEITQVRTKKNESADIIEELIMDRNNANDSSEVRLSWREPSKPNALIHSYRLETVHLRDSKPTRDIFCLERLSHLRNGRMVYEKKYLEAGNYTMRVQAVSRAGYGPFSLPVSFLISPPVHPSPTHAWITVLLAVLFIALFVTAIVIFWRRFNPPAPKLFPTVNPEYVSANSVYVQDEWEIPREKIELIRELGQGSFGMVYEGIARDLDEGQPCVPCAVKTVNEVANERDRHEFLNEASVMKAFNTHHVVRLLGVVSSGQPTLVVMELMSNGDLKTYLRNHRPEHATDGTIVVPPTLKRILQMAIEIADGMAYLAAKKFVHRDLAARNCMVAEDLTVKIGDFGMTRDIYETDYYKKGTKGLLPVRWMSPESLKDGVFSSRSDVWSFGVVLWEMVTLASQPYLGLSNDQVLRYVIEGGVMERPENCPDKLYELMQICWQHRPTQRPTFMDLVTHLLPDANQAFYSLSFYHSPEGCEIRTHELETQVAEMEASFGTPRTPLRATTEADESDDFSSVCSDLDGIALRNTRSPPVQTAQVSSSDSSRGSKMSNGGAPINGLINNITPC